MDKAVSHMFQKAMKEGEKKSPVKSIKLKVKFEGSKKPKSDSKYEAAKRGLAKRHYEYHEKA